MSLQSCVSNRLVIFGLALSLGSALACYSDKPGTGAKKSQAASGLELQPLPMTHDTLLREVDSFALNQDVIDRWAAAKKNLDSITTTNPEIIKRLKALGVPSGIGEMGKRLEAEPKLDSALVQSHIDGHTYMLATIALEEAIHGYQLKQTGKLSTLRVPPQILTNIDFVSAHLPQVMQAMSGQRSMRMPAAPR
jgi:hypothetical protein